MRTTNLFVLATTLMSAWLLPSYAATGRTPTATAAEPARITVTGPKRHVDTLEEALTDPVDASGTMHRGVFMTHVYLSDPLVQVLNPSPVQVTVIMERTPERPVVSPIPEIPR